MTDDPDPRDVMDLVAAERVAFAQLRYDVSRKVEEVKEVKEVKGLANKCLVLQDMVTRYQKELEEHSEHLMSPPSFYILLPLLNYERRLFKLYEFLSWEKDQHTGQREASCEDLRLWLDRIGELVDKIWESYQWYLVQLLVAHRLLNLFAPKLLEFPGGIRYLCTTMPWTIWPALVVLWGVCWMFIAGGGIWEDALDNYTWAQGDGLMMFYQEGVAVFPESTDHGVLSARGDVLPVAGTVSAIPEGSFQAGGSAAIYRPTTSENAQLSSPAGDNSTEKGSTVSASRYKCQSCPSHYAQPNGLTRHVKGAHPQEYQRMAEGRRRGGGQSNKTIKYYFCPNRKCRRSRGQPDWPGFNRRDHLKQHLRRCKAPAEENLAGSQESSIVAHSLEQEISNGRLDRQLHARTENEAQLGRMAISQATRAETEPAHHTTTVADDTILVVRRQYDAYLKESEATQKEMEELKAKWEAKQKRLEELKAKMEVCADVEAEIAARGSHGGI